jgi:hypothetical protein
MCVLSGIGCRLQPDGWSVHGRSRSCDGVFPSVRQSRYRGSQELKSRPIYRFLQCDYLQIGCVCSDASIDENGTVLGQPTEGALIVLGMKVRALLALFSIY